LSAQPEPGGFDRPRRANTGLALGVAALVLALLALIVASRPRRSPAPGPAGRRPSVATVTADSAPLRSEAGGGGDLVAELPRAARLTVLADQGAWLHVRTSDDRTGYVASDLVETDAERIAREKRKSRILAFAPVYGIVAEDTDILLAPFPLAARAGRLRRGAAMLIHAVDHDYYAFKDARGELAFVRSADVDLIPPDPRRPAIVPEPARALKDVRVADLPRREATPESGEEPLEPGPMEPSAPLPDELEPPVLVSKVDPVYPEPARRAGVEGTVVLEASIDERGRVTDVQVLRGLPMGLSESAEEAVRHWQYRPARGQSGPVRSRKTVRIVFTLGE
jgi:protein TonB